MIEQVAEPKLKAQLTAAVGKLSSRKEFGLVFRFFHLAADERIITIISKEESK